MNPFCSATPCPVILNATCVFYKAGDLICTGINTNDTLEMALIKIDQTICGISGTTGTSGTSGTSGSIGPSGTNGTSGINGISGTSGVNGTSGINGTNGTSGTRGSNGTSGLSGTSGVSGTNGVNGTNGINGTSGISGTSGINGTNGVNGTNGTSGSNGSNGTSGINGTNGIDGTSGVNGTSGSTGSAGTSGTSPVAPIVPEVQNPTVAQRRNIDVYNGKYFVPNGYDTNQSAYASFSQPVFFGAGNGSVHVLGASNSMLRSTDNGLTWSAINSDVFGITAARDGVACSGVIYIGNNTFIATFLGGYDSAGIIYSTDNGITWNLSSVSAYPNSTKSKFVLDCSKPAFLNVGGVPTVVVGMGYSIYYSIDNGVTFIPINPVSGNSSFPIVGGTLNNSFVVNASNGYFFASVSVSALTYFLYSVDGINWTYSGATPIALKIVGIEYNNGRYFVNQITDNNTYYTTNFTSFTTVTRTPYFSTMTQSAQAYNGNTIISVGKDVLKSTDNGTTWTSLFNDNGLTVFSGLVNGYVSSYVWFDGVRFNILASVNNGSMVLLYDADGTGTTWDFSPIDVSTENGNLFSVGSIYLISNTRYVTQTQLRVLPIFKTVVRDTPGNGNVSIDVCQSAYAGDLGYYYSSASIPANYYNYKYVNNRFIAPTSLYFALSVGSDPTQKWTRSLVKNTRLNNTTTTLNGVGFANGYWVGFGNGGILSTSPDLVNWTVNASTQATSGTNSFSEIASIGSIGVVINESYNDVWTSSNVGSVPFTSNTIAGFSGGFRSIAASPSTFVIGGNGANVAYSTNGTTWTNVNFFGGTSATVNRIVYLNGKFIICHQYGVSVSSDGITWTSPFTSVNGPQMNNCIYTGTHWIACGNNNTIIRSSDGVVWNYIRSYVINNQSTSPYSSIASDGNGNVVIPLSTSSNVNGTIAVSNDHGSTWRYISVSKITGPVIYGNGYFILASTPHYYYSSNGGNTWDMIDSQNGSIEIVTGPGMKKVNGKYFVYQGSMGTQTQGSPGMRVADSLTGTWSTCKTGLSVGNAINDIASNGNSYIAVTTNNKILRSVDGINFTDVSPVTFGYVPYSVYYFVEYGNGIFIAGGYNGVLYKSTTGEYGTWIPIESISSNQSFTTIAYGNGIWILPAPGKILISYDNGTTWITSRVNFTSSFSSYFIRFYNGFFYLAPQYKNMVYRSTDGITWKLVNMVTATLDAFSYTYIYALEQDESTGYLYLFTQSTLQVSTDNGLTFNSVQASPLVAFDYRNVNSIPYNYRNVVEDGYVYMSMPPEDRSTRTMNLPYQFLGYPVLEN